MPSIVEFKCKCKSIKYRVLLATFKLDIENMDINEGNLVLSIKCAECDEEPFDFDLKDDVESILKIKKAISMIAKQNRGSVTKRTEF